MNEAHPEAHWRTTAIADHRRAQEQQAITAQRQGGANSPRNGKATSEILQPAPPPPIAKMPPGGSFRRDGHSTPFPSERRRRHSARDRAPRRNQKGSSTRMASVKLPPGGTLHRDGHTRGGATPCAPAPPRLEEGGAAPRGSPAPKTAEEPLREACDAAPTGPRNALRRHAFFEVSGAEEADWSQGRTAPITSRPGAQQAKAAASIRPGQGACRTRNGKSSDIDTGLGKENAVNGEARSAGPQVTRTAASAWA